ncbi:MAG: type II secretion system F family protein [Phycisphaerales bacterium]|nr:type II secretion system F family protein [Phycisphaerales bacterium]
MIPMSLAFDPGTALTGGLLILLPLLGAVLLSYGVAQVAFDLRANDKKRVQKRLRGAPRTSEDRLDFTQFRKQTAEATGALARAFTRLSFTARLQRTLEQANLPWSASQTLVNLTAVASILLAALLVFGISPLVAGGVAAGVFILPLVYFGRCRNKRLTKLSNQLPDVFELLSQALRAGNSLASAMQVVAKQLPDPAGTEFGRVFHEQNLGLKIEDALRNMADRVDLLDVRFFVTAVLIQRQVGGDLAEVLDKISSVIRERIQLFGTVQALTAEGRLSGYVLLALPVLVFFILMYVNPEYMSMLLIDPTGKMLLTVAVVMQLMGWALIKKIVNIKV